MNDLTFGAALLACFVTLATAAVIETSAPAQRHSTPVAARPAAAVQVALASRLDCVTVAQAPKSH